MLKMSEELREITKEILMVSKGCFIVFEGTEGSGKTVASKGLHEWLRTKGRKALWTREPTNSRLGMLIGSILDKKIRVAEESIPLLFAADRADHTRSVIRPTISKGYVVVCDRYIYSSLAYQSSGMTIPFNKRWLEEINRYSLKPDLVFFLDIDPEKGLRRIEKGQRIQDDKFFDNLNTQRLVHDSYYEILNLNRPLMSFFKEEIFPSSLLSKLKAMSAIDGTIIISIDALSAQNTVQGIINEVVWRFLNFKERRKKKSPFEPKEFLKVLTDSDFSFLYQTEKTMLKS